MRERIAMEKRIRFVRSRVAPLVGSFALLASCSSAPEKTAKPAIEVRSSFEDVIRPILEKRCVACHGATKSKGKLRLDSREGLLAGGASGPVLAIDGETTSELLRRVKLAQDDPDHMPPDDKPQPQLRELRALEAWITAGAPFEGRVDTLDALSEAPPPPALEIAPAPPSTIDALRAALIHVEPREVGSNALVVDVAAIASNFDDAAAKRYLAPLALQVVDVSLARSKVGDETARMLAGFRNLRRIDLRGTRITSDGVRALGTLANLEELVLAGANVGDVACDSLASLHTLKRLYVWRCGLSGDALERLRHALPKTDVDAGDLADSVALEVESKPEFTSDAPIPGAPPPGSAEAPINVVCPVTGSPVNPKYTLLVEGRLIGFCCPNCPGEFQKDPKRYVVKSP